MVRNRFTVACVVILIVNVKCAIRDFDMNTNVRANIRQPSTKTEVCPFSKIIEDIFKIKNQTSESSLRLKDGDRTKFLSSTLSKRNITSKETLEDELVNKIIASISKIQENFTVHNDSTSHLNEAIIIDIPKKANNNIDNKIIDITKVENKNKHENTKNASDDKQTSYVEILTIEPNNTSINNNSTTTNIVDILKHLMPMFNSTLTQELHNITVIERNRNRDNSYTSTKNVSTIVVTYCDKEKDTVLKDLNKIDDADGYLYFDHDVNDDEHFHYANLSKEEKRDILEAADYGVQKMYELYSVTEPKLYSMGLWLDEKEPGRYLAAFNAPSEEAARFSRYGYASLQAATKLKELINGGGTSDDEAAERRETAITQLPGVEALKNSPLLKHCPLRNGAVCPPASKRYRTHDGTCNNLHRPRWGSTMTPVQRFLHPSYSDDLQAPRVSVFGKPLPSAREISAIVHEDRNVETASITHLLMQWGQFIDHDITSSSQSRGFNGSVPRCCKDGGRNFVPKEFMHPECMPIAVPPSDPFYGRRGVRCLEFTRSSPAPRDDCALGWREQLNQVSAYIDGSPLYGSSARQSDRLRLFRNGMLQYGRTAGSSGSQVELCRGGALSSTCFRSGDGRVNEHPGLVAAHIVWLKHHNRLAQELSRLNRQWSDEKTYQETRRIIGAMLQHITYNEFLPIVLGTEVMRLFDLVPQRKGYYRDYDAKSNPSPASSFSSAAFRFGHSLVQPSMMRFDRFHRPMDNNVSLHDEPNNPNNIWSVGAVDRLLLGMVNQPIQKRDEFITEELTNHLFQTPQFDFGMDLAAINIQRGRDHGVPSYTSWREPCGLSPLKEFDDLFRVMPSRAVRKIEALYRHVDDIDLFTGGMAERPVVGGLVGPTFACIIAQQFSNLRKGDRFWYENGGFDSSFTPAQLQQIRRVTFSQVLCRTLDHVDSMQDFAFLAADRTTNERISCGSGSMHNFDLSPWIEIDPEQDRVNAIQKSEEAKPDNNATKTQEPTKTDKPSTTTKPQIKIVTKLPTRTKPTQTIDDKLDFKNKSRRYDNRPDDRYYQTRPTKQYDYDYEDEPQSQQTVFVNNLPYQRPYNRPVIAVTENVDKYTYLINYVPRPTTQSWRRTTKKPVDKNVVKVTYQTYDDTYRRPNRPYKHDRPEDFYRNRPDRYTTKTDLISSARSNDDDSLTTLKNTEGQTTDNYRLVTFRYVGTYKGHDKIDSTDDNTDKLYNKPDRKADEADKTDNKYDRTDNNTNKFYNKPDRIDETHKIADEYDKTDDNNSYKLHSKPDEIADKTDKTENKYDRTDDNTDKLYNKPDRITDKTDKTVNKYDRTDDKLYNQPDKIANKTDKTVENYDRIDDKTHNIDGKNDETYNKDGIYDKPDRLRITDKSHMIDDKTDKIANNYDRIDDKTHKINDKNDKMYNKDRTDDNSHKIDDKNDKRYNKDGIYDKSDRIRITDKSHTIDDKTDSTADNDRINDKTHKIDDKNDKTYNKNRIDGNDHKIDDKNDKTYNKDRIYDNPDIIRITDKIHTIDDKTDLTANNYDTDHKIHKIDKTYDKSDKINYQLDKIDQIPDNSKYSKDFSTHRPKIDFEEPSAKLSTFFHYETATRPYNLHRPTRKDDSDDQIINTKTKYYYIRNVLHRYPSIDLGLDSTNSDTNDRVEERSSADNMDDLELKAETGRKRPISSAAKTPSVTFQVIPSENSASLWAVYDEKDMEEDSSHVMPPPFVDPLALEELPRPMKLSTLRRRKPSRS